MLSNLCCLTMSKFSYRRWQIILTLLSFTVLVSSFYFQYVKQLQPCPLCLMQRLCVFLLFMFSFIGVYIQTLKAGKRIARLQFIIALGGLFFACRQLWLQSLPTGQTPACMPGLDILIRYFPWQDVLRTLLWGTGECAEISWRWLGLSMPAWSALYFLFMAILALPIYWILAKQLANLLKRT